MTKSPTTSHVPGEIRPGSILTAQEAQARLRLGTWAWREQKRKGLRVFRVGNIRYVLADDLIEHFRRLAEQSETEG